MNDIKKPDNGEEVESWFIDKEISTEKTEDGEFEVQSVSLHDTDLNGVAAANDAAIIGGPVNPDEVDSFELSSAVDEPHTEDEPNKTSIRKSILKDSKEPTNVEVKEHSDIDSDIPNLETADLVATRTDNIEETVSTDKTNTSETTDNKLSNLESAPEYLQEENPQTTAERRYDFISPAKPKEEPTKEPDLIWAEPETIKKPTSPAATSLEETIFEGATVVPTVPSRMAAHLWSLLLSLILLPLAWYYGLDVAQRLRVGPTSPWQGGPLTALIITELIGAIICIFLVVFLARFSSLGTFFTGIFITTLGIFTVFTPHIAATKLAPIFRALEHSNAENTSMVQNLMANIGKLLHLSAGSGLFLFIGIILLALGFVSHGARRKGRKDYLINRKVEDFK